MIFIKIEYPNLDIVRHFKIIEIFIGFNLVIFVKIC